MSIVYKSNSCSKKLEGLMNKVETPISKEPAYYHLVKADALRIKNYFWDSIGEYLRAIELDDSNIDAFKGLGLSYKQVGCTKGAISSFNSAKKLNPFDKTLYFEAGCCYCMDKKYSKAIIEFKKAIKLSPDYYEAHYNLALAYEMSLQNDLAIREYDNLIKKAPLFIKAHNSLASLHIKLNNYTEAAKVFRDLLKSNPEFTRAHLGIAISFDKLGDRSRAMRFYKKYLEQRPNSDNVPYIIDRINEIQKEKPAAARKSHLMLVS